MKKYTINEDSEIVECSPFGYEAIVIEAKNKTEATKKILNKFRNMDNFGPPKVYSKNNALCLIFHNGDGITSATCNKAKNESGEQFFSCFGGGYSTEKEAMEKSSFDYYASDEYQKA
jgi:hypothetical protein